MHIPVRKVNNYTRRPKTFGHYCILLLLLLVSYDELIKSSEYTDCIDCAPLWKNPTLTHYPIQHQLTINLAIPGKVN